MLGYVVSIYYDSLAGALEKFQHAYITKFLETTGFKSKIAVSPNGLGSILMSRIGLCGKKSQRTWLSFRCFLSSSGFKTVMLSGVRALVEQQPVADDYTKYK